MAATNKQSRPVRMFMPSKFKNGEGANIIIAVCTYVRRTRTSRMSRILVIVNYLLKRSVYWIHIYT